MPGTERARTTGIALGGGETDIMEASRGGDIATLQPYDHRSSSRSMGNCSNCCTRIASVLCSNLGVCALLLLYTVAGAFIFTSIEGNGLTFQVDSDQNGPSPPRDSAVLDNLLHDADGLRHETVEQLWTFTETLNILYRDNWTRVAEQELIKFSEKLLFRLREEQPPPKPAPTTAHTSHQWTFAGSFLYSTTVITTIGYGSVAPKTMIGRVVTILYALLGIPLMLLYLSSVGDMCSRALKWVWWRTCRCRRRQETSTTNHQSTAATPYTSVESAKRKWGGECSEGSSVGEDIEGETGTVPVTLCLLLMILYICGGAAVFAYAHHWSFLHAIYFCFSSLTTIGFGDLAPETAPNVTTGIQMVLLGAAFYLLVGMALIATCFNLMQEQLTNRGYGLGRRLGGLMTASSSGSNNRLHLDDTWNNMESMALFTYGSGCMPKHAANKPPTLSQPSLLNSACSLPNNTSVRPDATLTNTIYKVTHPMDEDNHLSQNNTLVSINPRSGSPVHSPADIGTCSPSTMNNERNKCETLYGTLRKDIPTLKAVPPPTLPPSSLAPTQNPTLAGSRCKKTVTICDSADVGRAVSPMSPERI